MSFGMVGTWSKWGGGGVVKKKSMPLLSLPPPQKEIQRIGGGVSPPPQPRNRPETSLKRVCHCLIVFTHQRTFNGKYVRPIVPV